MLIKSRGNGVEGESFFRWIYNRVMVNNKNAIIITLGQTGSGKSYSNLRIAERFTKEYLKKDYDIRNFTFTPRECMQRINSKELKRGDVLALEEGGVGLGARNWQNLVNKVVGYLVQTFRNMNLVFLINLPDIRFLDATIRRLCHATLTTKSIDFQNKIIKIVPKFRQHNYQMHKDYWKFMRIKKNGRVIKIRHISLRKPTDDLVKLYEEKKERFNDELNREIQEQIEVSDMKQNVKTLRKPLTEFQEKLYEYVKNHPNQLQKHYSEYFGVNANLISCNLRYIERKGHNIRDFLRKSRNSPIFKLRTSPQT